jgi:histidine decarboxylase
MNRYHLDPTDDRQLRGMLRRLDATRATNIGFPGAVDFRYSSLAPFLDRLINNIGDPYRDPAGADHTKDLERQVVQFLADLFRAPTSDRWGYVTTGGTEGNIHALYAARSRLPDAVLYVTRSAHYSVPKAGDLLRMPTVVVDTTGCGEMDYTDLRAAVMARRDRPAVVVANIGTTMTEAVDDTARIVAVLDQVGVPDRHVHADAALAGIPLALLDPAQRPCCDLSEGADSITVSGHKFLGCPFPCGVVLTRRSLIDAMASPVGYIGCADTTLTGSRSGHAPLLLWYALRRHGIDGLRRRAEHSRALAEHTLTRLTAMGWPAWRNPLAFTVMLKTPPRSVTRRWTLASVDGWSHLICMPGITREQIDAFLDALRPAATHAQRHRRVLAPPTTHLAA